MKDRTSGEESYTEELVVLLLPSEPSLTAVVRWTCRLMFVRRQILYNYFLQNILLLQLNIYIRKVKKTEDHIGKTSHLCEIKTLFLW